MNPPADEAAAALLRRLLPPNAKEGWHEANLRRLCAGFERHVGLLGECLQRRSWAAEYIDLSGYSAACAWRWPGAADRPMSANPRAAVPARAH